MLTHTRALLFTPISGKLKWIHANVSNFYLQPNGSFELSPLVYHSNKEKLFNFSISGFLSCGFISQKVATLSVRGQCSMYSFCLGS